MIKIQDQQIVVDFYCTIQYLIIVIPIYFKIMSIQIVFVSPNRMGNNIVKL